jgi:hypothetical protein
MGTTRRGPIRCLDVPDEDALQRWPVEAGKQFAIEAGVATPDEISAAANYFKR